MHLSERSMGEPFAEITGPVRHLAGLGVTVVVDSPPNSLDPVAITTTREVVFTVDSMDRKMAEAEFRTLFHRLGENKLADLVWDVVGGVPSDLDGLSHKVELAAG